MANPPRGGKVLLSKQPSMGLQQRSRGCCCSGLAAAFSSGLGDDLPTLSCTVTVEALNFQAAAILS